MTIKACLTKGEMTKVNNAVDKRKPATRKDQRLAVKQEEMFSKVMADKGFMSKVDKLSTEKLRITVIQNEFKRRGIIVSQSKIDRMIRGKRVILNPMTSVGELATCVIGKGATIPTSCNNYVRINKKWYLGDKEVFGKEMRKLDAMKLPPAWDNVVVSASISARVQAIGIDAAGRWQYRYSAAHIAKAKQKKFNRVKMFSKDMKGIRKQIAVGVTNNDPYALLLRLEDKTGIRMGSLTDFRAKQKAYGLTTLQNEHVIIRGNKITLDFVAKRGIPAHYELTDSTLANWLRIRKAETVRGERLFSDVSARKLNDYLRKAANGKKYTIKDFRTYHGSRIAFRELEKYAGKELTAKEKKEIIKSVLEKTSNFLANTPAMAMESYIDPMVWEVIGGL